MNSLTLEKQKYLEIVNDGEIDINAILLIGASTKRDDDSKIGYFGSGLKYSMATLLRHGIPFKIFSGMKEVKITTKKVELRGKEFRQIFINGKGTSMTLEMGIDWKPWFAVREVFCNAIDEGYHTLQNVDEQKPEAGCTKIYIGMHESLNDMFENWDKYFSDKRSDILQTVGNAKLLIGGNELLVYRKGIRVHQELSNCLFHYDMDWVQINESRVISSSYDFRSSLVKWFAKNASEETIRGIIAGNDKNYEWKMDWNHYNMTFNENWLTVINNRPLILSDIAGRFEEFVSTSVILPNTLCKALKEFFKEKVRILGKSGPIDNGRVEVPETERQTTMIANATEYLLKCGIIIQYPIHVVQFSDIYTLGQAEKGEIYISEKVFENGKRAVVTTILEENSHLVSGKDDKTRDFQDYLLNEWLKSMEKNSNEYL